MEKKDKLKTTVQRELAKIIGRIDFDCLVTISKVEINNQKTNASIFLSVFPFDKIEEVAKEISSQKRKIQKEFSQINLKSKLRLNFFIDPQAEQTDYLNKLK
jgi:ribosome-binding factor A